ncbi:hypothetical protein ACFWWM_42175 [Streptomyces sp. NPDC058682]|uniref:hypothetical protein n=1 Tax=unclassified Streptomyces TaxID=2593676 RepID=UPI00224F1BCB|nr:hypothetical protein [Streptomyces sp. NBC_01214]MCX4807236.1 hypothetical protein [Streptomyces sp. NBC_01214]
MEIAAKATAAAVLAAFVCAGLITPQAASADSPPSTGGGTLSAQEVGAAKAANDDRNDRSKDGWGGRDAPAAEIRSKDASMAAHRPNAGASTVGNSMEVYNGPHLVGHPNNSSTIYHWFPLQGYDGDWAAYLDSATTVWSSVPARSGMPNSPLVTIMGGRGYHW